MCKTYSTAAPLSLFFKMAMACLCLMLFSSYATAQPISGYYAMTTPSTEMITHKEISQRLHLPYPLPKFNPKRTAEEWSQCKHWATPEAPDAQSQEWYRAATSIHGINLRTVQQHQQMLQLYEAAARRGHYMAAKNLSILYSERNLVVGARFGADPEKAHYWLTQAIREHGWIGALEWVPFILGSEGSGLSREDYKLAYLQAAADNGISLAQHALAETLMARYKLRDERRALLRCAADQGWSGAAYTMGSNLKVGEEFEQALHYYQIAVMNGGEGGGDAAYALQTFPDHSVTPLRRGAYEELDAALRGTVGKYGNIFYRFPRLNEVLPLPPAEITEWKGIYSAMSPEDAEYYQNPPPAEFYLKQVEEAGLLVPLEYLTQPYYPKPGESLI